MKAWHLPRRIRSILRLKQNLLTIIISIALALWMCSCKFSDAPPEGEGDTRPAKTQGETQVVPEKAETDQAETGQPAGPEEVLRKRAQEYWDHKVNGEWDKAYPYEEPASLQGASVVNYVQFLGKGTKWLGAEVGRVTIVGDGMTARVEVRVRYKWSFAKEQPEDGMVSTIWEQWQRIDDTWYHVYRKPLNFKRKAAEGSKDKGVVSEDPKGKDERKDQPETDEAAKEGPEDVK